MIVLVNMFVVAVDVGIMVVGISDFSITGVHGDHKLWRDIWDFVDNEDVDYREVISEILLQHDAIDVMLRPWENIMDGFAVFI